MVHTNYLVCQTCTCIYVAGKFHLLNHSILCIVNCFSSLSVGVYSSVFNAFKKLKWYLNFLGCFHHTVLNPPESKGGGSFGGIGSHLRSVGGMAWWHCPNYPQPPATKTKIKGMGGGPAQATSQWCPAPAVVTQRTCRGSPPAPDISVGLVGLAEPVLGSPTSLQFQGFPPNQEDPPPFLEPLGGSTSGSYGWPSLPEVQVDSPH